MAENTNTNGEWVKPWENIDEQNYGEVRAEDKIEPVLNSRSQSQYTRFSIDDEVRLRDTVISSAGFPDMDNNGLLDQYDISYIKDTKSFTSDEINKLDYFGDGPVSTTIIWEENSPASAAIADFLYNLGDGEAADLSHWSEFISNSQNKRRYNIVHYQNLKKYLRLIMPKYMRRVEVEDLDRNFWVIGQTITGICGAVFGDNSAYLNMFNGILDEITQLWENTLYLWAAAELVTRKAEPEVRCIHCYLDNSDIQPILKYDNFGETVSYDKEEIKKRLKRYQDQFPENHLVILPEIREKNYKHNYYAVSYFPCVYYYNRLKGEVTVKSLLSQENPVKVDLTKGGVYMGAILIDDEASQYRFVKDWSYPHDEPYYGLLRVNTDIDAYVGNGEIFLNTLSITYTDISQILMKPSVSLNDVYQIFYEYNTETSTEVQVTKTINYQPPLDNGHWDTIPTVVDITTGFYQGEVVSYLKPPAIEFQVVKIGDFYPKKFIEDQIDGLGTTIPFLTEITLEKSDGNEFYDTQTYGIGAFILRKEDPLIHWEIDNHLIYVSYNKLVKEGQVGVQDDISKFTTEGLSLRIDDLDKDSEEYIVRLKQDGKLGNPYEDGIYATRFDTTYWDGNSGAQWSSGIIHALVYYNGSTQEAKVISHPQLFDGYWTSNTTVFSEQSIGGGSSRWRRIYLGCSGVTPSNEQYNMTDGQLIWYDHWNDINSSYGKKEPRPNAKMSLVNNEIVFTDEENLLDPSNTAMALKIHYSDTYVFNHSPERTTLCSNGTTVNYYDNKGPILFDSSTNNVDLRGYDSENCYIQ